MKRALLLAAVFLALGPSSAQAAGEPAVSGTWVDATTTSAVNLRAEINPEGSSTSWFFEYATETAYLANGFNGATRAPLSPAGLAAGMTPAAVLQHIGGLVSGTTYRYRVNTSNAAGPTVGPTHYFATDEAAPEFRLPDSRGWEMVSPIDKNGGQIPGAGAIFGGGILEAAAAGGAITYSSSFSFATPAGAAGASQYISRRTGAGWDTENITLPALSGTFPFGTGTGVPFQLFSGDLATALVSNGRRCREAGATGCPVENPPLAGSGAPSGYRNYYLRENGIGTYRAVLAASDLAGSALGPEAFEVALAAATPDLSQIVLSTCAKLTADATETPGSGGECAPTATNLYLKSDSSIVRLINLRPGDVTGTPGAAIASQSRAISGDGNRVYWTLGGNLYLREGAVTKQADAGLGGGATFQTASLSGDIAYLTKGGHLWRYSATSDSATDITPGGGVEGVLGTSDDGASVYYQTNAGIFLNRGGSPVLVATGPAAPSSYPPSSGTARVSPDGNTLLFVSAAELADYDNHGIAEVYLYSAPTGAITCVSCNPSGERPLGPAGVPGAEPEGSGPNAQDVYKPRVLSSGSNRVFFESADALVPQDSNGDTDVYEWEADGVGSCAIPRGCVALISSGRSEGGARFADASTSGDDAYFRTDGSLVPSDPGAIDLYDARVGGGFPPPVVGIPCFGDACQSLPGEPEDPTPGTLRANSRTNPPVAVPIKQPCKRGKLRKKGKCVAKKKPAKRKHRHKGGKH